MFAGYALLIGIYYVFELRCHDLQLVGFHVSFKYVEIFQLRVNFQFPNCHTRNFFGLQIPVTTGVFELGTSCIQTRQHHNHLSIKSNTKFY